MKGRISLACCLLICLLTLAGCSCKHTWIEANCVTARTCSACSATEGEPLGHTWVDADCVTAKTCSVCNATEGNPVGHTPGQWQEETNIVTAAVSRVQYCAVCNEQTASETAPLNTMIQDGLFQFTPNEFMDRLAAIAGMHVDGFSYEFTFNNGLMAYAYSSKTQVLVQFFRNDATAFSADERNVPEVWCVSLTEIGEADTYLRYCFFMACDPILTEDTAYQLDAECAAAFLTASFAGDTFGYYRHNDLLYETIFIPEGAMGQTYSMNLINIYASDFR